MDGIMKINPEMNAIDKLWEEFVCCYDEGTWLMSKVDFTDAVKKALDKQLEELGDVMKLEQVNELVESIHAKETENRELLLRQQMEQVMEVIDERISYCQDLYSKQGSFLAEIIELQNVKQILNEVKK
jgi:hypothetical protein